MRALVDIPEKLIEDLAKISQAKKISRAEIIRQAIVNYVADNKSNQNDAFGLWTNKIDGLEYQEKLRSEW